MQLELQRICTADDNKSEGNDCDGIFNRTGGFKECCVKIMYKSKTSHINFVL